MRCDCCEELRAGEEWSLGRGGGFTVVGCALLSSSFGRPRIEICGKRLHPLLPNLIEAMERHGHGAMDSEKRRQLLTMSPATIDRVLKDIKASASGPRRRKGSTTIRRSVPVRTFSDWDGPAPGFVVADLVSHSAPYAKGAFSQTLVLTDIATGWTECAPLLVREQTVLITALAELRKSLPFPLLGFDTDNHSVFMNELHAHLELKESALANLMPYERAKPSNFGQTTDFLNS